MISEKLFQLNTLVLCDTPSTEKPDAFYIFAEPATHIDLLVSAVAPIAKQRKIKVAICGGVGQGYDFRVWFKALRENGLKEDEIVLISPDEYLNTITESTKLAQHAKMFGWKNIWITAPPFQQLRAFITLASMLKKEFWYAKIFNMLALPIDWYKEIIHYHGEVRGKPFVDERLDR